MLIFRMAKGACRYCFCPWRRAIHHLWMFATNSQLDYPRCKTNNWWRSIDTHFQDGAGTESRLFLPLKAANTSFMDVCNQSPVRLPKMQDQKSLVLSWCTFSGWGRERIAIIFPLKAANTSFMDVCNQSPLWLPKMQSQKLFTLHWCSFSEWGSDPVNFCFAYKCCEYVGYE